MKCTAPLRRARRDDQNDISFAIFGVQSEKILILKIKENYH